MPLADDVILRFRVQSDGFQQDLDKQRAHVKETAKAMLEGAGSVDKAAYILREAAKDGSLKTLGIDRRELTKVISQVKALDRETQQLAHHTANGWKEASQEARAYNHTLEGLRNISEGNFLGGVAKLGRGLSHLGIGGLEDEAGLVKTAAAAAGIAMVGRLLKDATDKAHELRDQYEEGKINAAGMVDKLMESLPVLGDFYTATKNITDLLDDDTHFWELQVKLLEQTKTLRESILAIAKQERQIEQDSQRTIDRIKEDTTVTALKDKHTVFGGLPVLAETTQLNQGAQRTADEFSRKQFEEADKLNAELDKKRAEAQAQLNDLNARIKGLQATAAANAVTGPHQIVSTGGVSVDLTAALTDPDAAARLARAKADAANLQVMIADIDRRKLDNTSGAWADAARQGIAVDDKRKADLHAIIGSDTEIVAQAKELGHRIGEEIKKGLEGSTIGHQIGGIVLKANDWLKDLTRQREQYRKDAEKVREESRTPADKLRDQLNSNQFLLDRGFLTKDTVQSFDQNQYTKLSLEKAKLGDADRDVWKLPNISEIRQGQTLYQPERAIDQQKLEELKQINAQLQELNDNAGKDGFTLKGIE